MEMLRNARAQLDSYAGTGWSPMVKTPESEHRNAHPILRGFIGQNGKLQPQTSPDWLLLLVELAHPGLGMLSSILWGRSWFLNSPNLVGLNFADYSVGLNLVDYGVGLNLVDYCLAPDLVDYCLGPDLVDYYVGPYLVDYCVGPDLVDYCVGLAWLTGACLCVIGNDSCHQTK